MIEIIVAAFYSSRRPWVVRLRKFTMRHAFVFEIIRGAVSVVRLARDIARYLKSRFFSSGNEKFQISDDVLAVLDARSIDGSLDANGIQELWRLSADYKQVLCIGSGSELDQVVAVLKRRGIKSIQVYPLSRVLNDEVLQKKRPEFIVVSDAIDSKVAAAVRSAFPDTPIFAPFLKGAGEYTIGSATQSLKKGNATPRKRVVLLNDVGFQFGAGVAHRRQAMSFLLNGWDVSAIASRPISDSFESLSRDDAASGNWGGMVRLPYSRPKYQLNEDEITEKVLKKIEGLSPDVIVVGNYHGSGLPMSLLSDLRGRGHSVLAYMHDTFWVTGRCAQPDGCVLFRSGCDERCPTPHEYPRLEPNLIAGAWRDREKLFTGPNAIPLIANSNWTRDIALQRFGTRARTEVVHLGLDSELFAPIDKAVARRLLGIPEEQTIVVMGAVDVNDRWKGGAIFHEVYRALTARPDVGLILFGNASDKLPSVKSFGTVKDERLMPLIYNAADVFLSTATAESFGQTLMEASACGTPAVALNVGGVADVIEHDSTGILVDEISSIALLEKVDVLVKSPRLRQEFGVRARAKIESQFTLEHQGRSWADCIEKLC